MPEVAIRVDNAIVNMASNSLLCLTLCNLVNEKCERNERKILTYINYHSKSNRNTDRSNISNNLIIICNNNL